MLSYSGAHGRIRSRRGRAGDLICLHCGGPAFQWAYDYSDPNELCDADGQRYSEDPEHYLPLCVSCHKKHDAKVKPPKNPWDTRGRSPCGTRSAYRRGCRCVLCRKASSEYAAVLRGRRPKSGRKPGRRKLNEIQVEEIRSRILNGEIHREIGLDYGVSRQTVDDIATGATWRDVPAESTTNGGNQ